MIEMPTSHWPILDTIDTQCKPSSSSSPYIEDDDPINPSTAALHAMLQDSDSDSEPDDSDMDSDSDDVEDILCPPPSPTPKRYLSPLSSSSISSSEEPLADDSADDACHTYTVQYSPPRHQYSHHGYSRLGLGHLRWFWSLREDAWAYDGLAQPIEYTKPTAPGDLKACMTPESMHPRRGDISALRDPYCASVDKCFARLPVWTMSKTLWMFDVHVGATRPTAVPPPCRPACSDSETEDESLGASLLSCKSKASEDSDTTLVESESEDGWSVVSPSSSSASTSLSSPISQPSRSPSSYFEHVEDKKIIIQDEETETELSDDDDDEDEEEEEEEEEYACVPRVWATNWYRRWELLIRLVRLDQERKRARAAKQLAQDESDPDDDTVGVGT